ncbi:MAG: hypothetical protein U0797_23845 [Gemmataceae bacterium]
MRDLLPLLASSLILAALTGGLLIASFVIGRPILPALSLLLAVNLLLAAWWSRWTWRFARRTRRFATLPCGRVVLRYSPQLNGYCAPQTP